MGEPAVPNVNYTYLNYDWGSGAPTDASGQALDMPVDQFSAVFTTYRTFEEGIHTFNIRVNDGIIMYVDDALVLTQFTPLLFPYGEYSVPVNMTAGEHKIEIWYVDYTGSAIIQVDWGSAGFVPLGVDGRFCFGAGETAAALYAVGDGFQVYGVSSQDTGWLALNITADALDELPAMLEQNLRVATSKDGKIAFYKLTSGEYQINVGPDLEGKTHVCTFRPSAIKSARVTSFK
jgi:hypothetical protein